MNFNCFPALGSLGVIVVSLTASVCSLFIDVCLFIVIDTVEAIPSARHCEARSNLICKAHPAVINKRVWITTYLPPPTNPSIRDFY